MEKTCTDCEFNTHWANILDTNVCNHINESKIIKTYKKGEIVFMQNNPVGKIYFIRSGLLKLEREENLQNSIIAFVRKGLLLGLFYLSERNKNPFTAIAIHDTECCEIDIATFKKLCETNLKLSLLVSKQLAAFADFSVISNAVKQNSTALQKVAYYFLCMAKFTNSNTVPVLLNKDIANFLSLNENTVYKNIKKLKELGYITKNQTGFLLNNPDLLREILSNS